MPRIIHVRVAAKCNSKRNRKGHHHSYNEDLSRPSRSALQALQQRSKHFERSIWS